MPSQKKLPVCGGQKKEGRTFLRTGNSWQLLDSRDANYIKPFVKPEHLKKWSVKNSDLSLIYVGDNELPEGIKDYLMQFSDVLVNRSTIAEGQIISFKDFESFSTAEIEKYYSLAGAVQKTMKKMVAPALRKARYPLYL
jgi:hypothetical protein